MNARLLRQLKTIGLSAFGILGIVFTASVVHQESNAEANPNLLPLCECEVTENLKPGDHVQMIDGQCVSVPAH